MSLEDSCAHPDVQVGGPGWAPPTMWMTLRFQQMQPGPMPSSSAAAEAKSDEESTTDESSSSEMSFTAPASSRPETVLPVSKRAKAAPRCEGRERSHEARELFRLGQQANGPLSRQSAETILSYIGRRKRWWI